MAETEEPSPLTPSADYMAMAPYWATVNAILCGVEALRVPGGNRSQWGPQVPYANLSQLRKRSHATESPFLPRYPLESDVDYDLRRATAPLTNIYADASANLASKPFRKECALDDKEPDDLKALAEDIDGQGNNLHVFAGNCFKAALDKSLHWILVDHTKVPAGTTLADERAMGARPYWVHVAAEQMIAVYSVFFQGRETFIHARIHEPATRRDGYEEAVVNRVRELNRDVEVDDTGNIVGLGGASYRVLEERDDDGKKTWSAIEEGPITLGIIPLVPFVIGKREGTSWRIEPALRNIANMQITSFQMEADLHFAGIKTASPILVGEGIPAPADGAELKIKVGPSAVLLAPPGGDGNHGTWKYIEIAATSLEYLAARIDKLHTEMRDLAMQPLTTANLTVITTANVSMKANSAAQAWALGLKDALEQAWKITCRWLKQEREPAVIVHTDFSVEMEAGKELDALDKARGRKDISQQTYWSELKRRGVLSDDFDPEAEELLLASEQEGLQSEGDIDPRTGEQIAPSLIPEDGGMPGKPTVN